MNRRPNSSGGDRSNLDIARRSVVVVAVRASKEIQRTALEWALTNVVRPGDCVRLLVLIPAHTSSKRLWGFSNFHSDCTAAHWRFLSGTKAEQKEYVTMTCNQMMCELQDMYDPGKVRVKLKVIYESKDGVVASEAKKVQTQWIILEKEMKKEAKCCVEQLDCNVIVVTNSGLKVLRLNLAKPNKPEKELLPSLESCRKHVRDDLDMLKIIKVPNVTPTSSPDRLSSVSSLDMIYSPKFMSEINLEPKVKQIFTLSLRGYSFCESDTESDSDNPSTLSASVCSQKWMADNMSSADEGSKNFKSLWRTGSLGKSFMSDSTCPFSKIFTAIEGVRRDTNSKLQNNMREMISEKKNTLPSPPLCSVCCHKTPSMGEPPRLFSYAELEKATTGFSQVNFLAEGGFGSVYHGVLQDGLVVAVKQQKLASTQGDREFCSEVQVLSCAQHRNVVMLIGYCAEENRRLLVYEYICNGSLDAHLYGRNQAPLNWAARQKIAVGSSRGLRYLHEECRVGCIVHRDLRPNNILLTHDFEPLVGDFGLARLQPDGESGVETQVIGTFGYLAPEYAQTGQVSEKADVYSFGVVLLDLITGRKAVDINRPKGQQCLTEWARPLAKENALAELIDPCLIDCYSEKEAEVMLHCASLCLQRDSQSRPRMSQVLRMLEGDILKCDEMALPLDDPENGH